MSEKEYIGKYYLASGDVYKCVGMTEEDKFALLIMAIDEHRGVASLHIASKEAMTEVPNPHTQE